LGWDAAALAAAKAAATPETIVGSLPAAETARAAAEARYALERQDWKAAAKLEIREGYAIAETLTRFARALGAIRSGDLPAARADVEKLRALRKIFDGAKQAYWAGQVEMHLLATQAWLANVQGHRREAHKMMRAAADMEDAAAKNPVIEN